MYVCINISAIDIITYGVYCMYIAIVQYYQDQYYGRGKVGPPSDITTAIHLPSFLS